MGVPPVEGEGLVFVLVARAGCHIGMTISEELEMKSRLRKLTNAALDLLFPLRCLGCRKEGKLLCPACVATLPQLLPPYCAMYANPATDRQCRRCAVMPLEVDGLRAPFLMEGTIRDAVHSLKYRNLRAAAPELGQLLAQYLDSHPMPVKVIVPVPLHPRRLRSRGYNQSELLARELGKLTGLPVNNRLLARTKNTPSQVSLANQEERRRNTAGSFACAGDAAGQKILLLDDVATTGSTISACAAALKTGGAASVWGLVLAREA